MYMNASGKKLPGASRHYQKKIRMIDFILYYIDWVGMIFLYLGYFRMLKVKPDAWIWTGLACIFLALSGLDAGRYGFAFGEFGFIAITIVGYLKWKKKLKKEL